MLPPRLQIFAVLVLVTFLLWVVWLIRNHRLGLQESFSWLLTTGAVLTVTLFPPLLRRVADLLGIGIASNALFALGFVYVAWNLLTLTLARSAQTTRLRRLVQEHAILQEELRRHLAATAAHGAGLTPSTEGPRPK